MPGFPSYYTRSLLEIPPSNTALVWLSIGLRVILDAYPPTPPKQVYLRCVSLTSYGFLQTLSLANNALAIRIIFPLVRVIQISFNLSGLPALLGKHRVGWGFCLIPLTEPYVRTSYTAHAFFTSYQRAFLNADIASHPVLTCSIEYKPSSSNHWLGITKLDKGLFALHHEFILMNLIP